MFENNKHAVCNTVMQTILQIKISNCVFLLFPPEWKWWKQCWWNKRATKPTLLPPENSRTQLKFHCLLTFAKTPSRLFRSKVCPTLLHPWIHFQESVTIIVNGMFRLVCSSSRSFGPTKVSMVVFGHFNGNDHKFISDANFEGQFLLQTQWYCLLFPNEFRLFGVPNTNLFPQQIRMLNLHRGSSVHLVLLCCSLTSDASSSSVSNILRWAVHKLWNNLVVCQKSVFQIESSVFM